MVPRLETYILLLGYPFGFAAIIDSLRRLGSSRSTVWRVGICVFVLTGLIFFFMLIFTMGASEY